MVKIIFIFLVFSLVQVNGKCQSKNTSSDSITHETVSFGIGAGLDYGGIGVNGSVFLRKNIGVFLGLGYNLIGPGYNAGLKYKFQTKNPNAKTVINLLAMYGYNGAIKITEKSGNSISKVYHGPAFGIELDTRKTLKQKSYLSVGLLVPVRPDFYTDYNNFKNQGASFNFPPLPVLLTLGYKFILNN